MDEKTMDKIVEHQVSLSIERMNINRRDLSDIEYLKMKYQMALILMCEKA